MRKLVALTLVACMPAALPAQEKKWLPPEIRKIQVGFKTFQDDDRTLFKVGLWTPIYVELFGGTDGIERKPNTSIVIATTDSEDVGTEVRVPDVTVEPLKARTFLAYVKTGHQGRTSNEITVTLYVNGRSMPPRQIDPSSSLQTDQHLYLTLGSRMTDIYLAVKNIGAPAGKEDDFRPDTAKYRHVVYETSVEQLPTRWFGYNSMDLVILATENRKFLTALNLAPDRLSALAEWVRRGGRLVVPIAPANQDALATVLSNASAWQPAIPVVPPAAAPPVAFENLSPLANWGRAQDHPFEHHDPKDVRRILPILTATLEPARVPNGGWEVEVSAEEKQGNRPLIAHVRYGLGKITYIAISLEDASFFNWKAGKAKFIEEMVKKLATNAPADVNRNNVNFNNFGMQNLPSDISTDIVNQLDNFDVRIIEFGYVALFIVLYILVVGPLDFVLLKYVFKRLEWTWITFPTVVLAVSVIAYFAAYALKGRDLKINKVDIVDFDLRTDIDAKGQPKGVRAYGTSFFTILSPRIQNYTLGMEANPLFWGGEVQKIKLGGKDVDEVLSVDLMSWMGRPSGGPNDMGRGGSGGFFRRPYSYKDDYSGLEGVPIPVWTTKAFCAAWERPLAKSPFVAELVYHQKDPENKQIKISGRLENHLGVDLTDAWLIYGKKAYAIAGGLKAVRTGDAPKPITLTIGNARDLAVGAQPWASMSEVPDATPEPRVGNSDPIRVVKNLLFHERIDTQNFGRNHLLRPLDLGWRVKEESPGIDHKLREAILFARVRFQSGNGQSLSTDTQNPLPTKIWLGDLPEPGKARPALNGILNQDTFIRVILAVRPAEE